MDQSLSYWIVRDYSNLSRPVQVLFLRRAAPRLNSKTVAGSGTSAAGKDGTVVGLVDSAPTPGR